MNNRKWLIIAGARPNFMKIAPLIRGIERYNADRKDGKHIVSLIVHTGQHYDKGLSDVFFEELHIPEPDINLGVGSGGHGEQTGKIMIAFEKVVMEHKPDLVVVVGDVNSTIACAMVAAKLRVPVAHVEAGLRSRDRSMPEEINRLLTDQISDFLFTPSREANENLLREGISAEKICFVGNIMVDSLLQILPLVRTSNIFSLLERIHAQSDNGKGYAMLTLHRPSNVDERDILERELACFEEISETMPILFPLHPRTARQLRVFGLDDRLTLLNERFEPASRQVGNRLYGLPSLGYRDFVALMSRARIVFTDSGGVQEESTVMGIPCLTLRDNTERPITVSQGTNILVGTDPDNIKRAFKDVLSSQQSGGRSPELWDGKTGERIVAILASAL